MSRTTKEEIVGIAKNIMDTMLTSEIISEIKLTKTDDAFATFIFYKNNTNFSINFFAFHSYSKNKERMQYVFDLLSEDISFEDGYELYGAK